MDQNLKLSFAILLCSTALLGASSTISADRALVHDPTAPPAQTAEPDDQYGRHYQAHYHTLSYDSLEDHEREIYLKALRKDGPVRTAAGNGFDDTLYGDRPTVLVITFPENGSQPPAFEGDPDARHDAMVLTTEPGKLPIEKLALRLGTLFLGLIGLITAVGYIFFSE